MRTASVIAFLPLLVLFALPAGAVTVDPSPEGVVAPSASRPQAAKPALFKLHLVVTESEAELMEWLGSGRAPRKTRSFKVQQPGQLSLVVTDFDLDGFDPVHLEARIRLYDPSGKLIYDHPDLAKRAWGQPKKGYLALAPQVDFSFEESDRKGTYTYEAVVRNRKTLEVARAIQQIELL